VAGAVAVNKNLMCVCGHRQNDHLWGSCSEGTKRCRCMAFKAQPPTRWDDDKEAGAIG
jgi:hypothetical protein